MAAVLPENAADPIAVANEINNINGNPNGNGNANARNRGLGGGAGQNNMMNMRDRLFHAIYFRAAAAYAELVPRKVQLTIEFLLLAKALVFFFTLVYVHNAFIKNPCTCLQEVQNWPREGVIRVEIIPHLAEKRAIWQSIKQDQQVVRSLKDSYYYDVGPQTLDNYNRLKRYEAILRKLGLPVRPTVAYSNETLYYYFDAINILDTYDHPNAIQLKNEDDDDEQYIVEYSLEYGHLRLSSATRKRLQIPVLTVQLDPNTNECFGDKLTRYLLKRLLGYDDLLMASVRTIAEKEENKGYLRNVITGEHYRFVSMWWAAWSSYPAAFSVMLLFTFSVSMLLRYSHHQIFVFIVDLLQMLEYNVSARFPIAPLLTVILALVGMEAIMSEFFNDTTTAFYIILIVWIADQYDAICCHTSITKRHWLRCRLPHSFIPSAVCLQQINTYDADRIIVRGSTKHQQQQQQQQEPHFTIAGVGGKFQYRCRCQSRDRIKFGNLTNRYWDSDFICKKHAVFPSCSTVALHSMGKWEWDRKDKSNKKSWKGDGKGFFYLYHFAFYAYHYRFSGQYRTLALLSSYLFIQHSMVFFFHRYELPAIMAQHQVFIVTRNQLNPGAAAGGAAARGAAAARVVPVPVEQQAAFQRVIHIMNRLFSQLGAQRQQRQLQQPRPDEPQRPPAGAGAGANNGTAAVAVALANLRRLPLVGQLLQRRDQFPTVRRVFLGHGGNGRMMHVLLQRVNMADIPELRNRVAAMAVAAAAAASQRAAAAAEADGGQAGETTNSSTPGAGAGAGAAAAAGATTSITADTTSTAADVEANQGRKEPSRGINDAAAPSEAKAVQGNDTQEQQQEGESKMEAPQEQDEAETGEGGQKPGVSKMLENPNSVAADIIYVSDKTTAKPVVGVAATQQPNQQLTTRTGTGTETGIETHIHVQSLSQSQSQSQSQPKAKQLENNLPEFLKAEGGLTAAASGEKQSCPLEAYAIMNDQQENNKPDEAATGADVATTSAAATSKQSTDDGAGGAAGAGAAAAWPMMDDRQTVDFIEDDRPTSTANCQLNAGPGHKAQREEQQEQQEQQKQKEHQQLMKTPPHTSNQVTTAATSAATSE
ncbi:GL17213 [Drosophila persimilis]|uniref:GL17213 n=1 Tax=Drosophila persimilis TaxID=7234 RepID=B4GG42_DROPE|nr:GL17213 [Drosophila persimilis]